MESTGAGLGSFGAYQIIRELGRGGMGVVYLAIDTRLGRKCALKTLLPGRFDADSFQRFEREAHAMARLRHPGLVQIYDFGVTDQIPFIALEYLPSGSIDQQIENLKSSDDDGFFKEPRWISQVIRWLIDVAGAMRTVHDRGIIHRDLKPENLLLRGEQVCVSDFGLARIQDAREQLTLTGEILGTPAYMAPEQIDRQSGTIDQRTDIYAIGVIGYRLLSGQLPYQASDTLGVLGKVLGGKRAALTDLVGEDVPRALIEIIERCMSVRQEDRFQSCSELVDQLHECLENEKGEKQQGAGFRIISRTSAALTVAFGVAAALMLYAGDGERQRASDLKAKLPEAIKQIEKLKQKQVERRKVWQQFEDLNSQLALAQRNCLNGLWDEFDLTQFCHDFSAQLTPMSEHLALEDRLISRHIELRLQFIELIYGFGQVHLCDSSLAFEHIRSVVLDRWPESVSDDLKLKVLLLAAHVSKQAGRIEHLKIAMARLNQLIKNSKQLSKTEREIAKIYVSFQRHSARLAAEVRSASGSVAHNAARRSPLLLDTILDILSRPEVSPYFENVLLELIVNLHGSHATYGGYDASDLIKHSLEVASEYRRKISIKLSRERAEFVTDWCINRYSPNPSVRLKTTERLAKRYPTSVALSVQLHQSRLFHSYHNGFRAGRELFPTTKALEDKSCNLALQDLTDDVHRLVILKKWSGLHVYLWHQVANLAVYIGHTSMPYRRISKTLGLILKGYCLSVDPQFAERQFINYGQHLLDYLNLLSEFDARREGQSFNSSSAIAEVKRNSNQDFMRDPMFNCLGEGASNRLQLFLGGLVPDVKPTQFKTDLRLRFNSFQVEFRRKNLAIFSQGRQFAPDIEALINLIFQSQHFMVVTNGFLYNLQEKNGNQEALIRQVFNGLEIVDLLLERLKAEAKMYETNHRVELTRLNNLVESRAKHSKELRKQVEQKSR